MSQGSHISERYYKSRIPKGSHTLGCNHIRVNPTGRCTTTQLPGLARTAKGSDATVAMSAASQAPHVPRAMRIAQRDAEYRQHQSPNGGRQTAQPASSGWHESKNMREAHPAPKSQHHLGATDNTRAAAVRCCLTSFPCASPASSSCWAGLKSGLYSMRSFIPKFTHSYTFVGTF